MTLRRVTALRCVVASALLLSTSASWAGIIGTIDVGDFGLGSFVDGGIDPAAMNVRVSGSITGAVTYVGQWGSEQGTGNPDFEDNHVFDGEDGYTTHAGGSTMTVVIGGLTAGQQYDLALTWRDSGDTVPNNRATNAPFTVSGLGSGDGTYLINQELVPTSDFTIANPSGDPATRPFQLLASGSAAGTSVTIDLSNDADEFVVADAFAVNLVPEPGTVVLAGFALLAVVACTRTRGCRGTR